MPLPPRAGPVPSGQHLPGSPPEQPAVSLFSPGAELNVSRLQLLSNGLQMWASL